MINIIYVVLSWGISILFGYGAIRQSKGTDWYCPISNKHEIIMITINIALIIIIPAFFYELLIIRQMYLIIFNTTFGIISITFIVLYLLKHPHNEKVAISDTQSIPNSVKLRKLIEKFITVFNASLFLCTIIYSLVWSETYYDEKTKALTKSITDYLFPIARNDNTLLISLSLIFWAAIIVVFLSVTNWNDEEDTVFKKYEPRRSISFFWNRVKQRGRKG